MALAAYNTERRSLTWSTQSHGTNTLANQFPSFQISAAQAEQGNVRVEARSPSGRIQDMGVMDRSGVYTANFTPTEVGDWLISIMYNREHIQGSPFNVRVYDAAQVKVFGLEGGSVGKLFTFQVDTSGAGDGELAVNITYNGRPVKCSVSPEPGRPFFYRIDFKPDGPGIYHIAVFFAGMEIAGSPYKMEIIDATQVTASGDGLRICEVNRASMFSVNPHGATGGDLKCNIRHPRGQVSQGIIQRQGDQYVVQYTLPEVGDYYMDVLYYNRPINGSPFHVQASDWSRITVNNLQGNGLAGRLQEFDIDAAHAGSGNLEIMVNDGTIPCSVQNLGNRHFHASFMPKESIAHYIQMKFNGREVPGSPWTVMVKSLENIFTEGLDQIIPVRQSHKFHVRARENFKVDANITSPSHRLVQCRIADHGPSKWVDFTPQEVGNHHVELIADGMVLPGSPFNLKVYDPLAIKVTGGGMGTIGRPVEYQVDVTQAGEGQLEIMVNRGSVPNSVKMLHKGVFLVSFVPRETRTHEVEIKFNGVLLPECPIMVDILDTSRVTVQGDGLRQVAVNQQSYFRVNTHSAGPADLTVRVTSPSGELVPAHIVPQPSGDYKVEYSSRYTGRHTVEILYAGQAIMGSPFYVEIYDPNKIRVEGVKSGFVAENINFEIIRHDAGKADLGLTITSPTGRNVPYDILPTHKGERVSYVPSDAGHHLIYITYGGLDVPGCPLTQTIEDNVGIITAHGDGLFKTLQEHPAVFYVDTQGRQGDLFVQVDGPNTIAKCNVDPEGAGRYRVTYVPVECGIYNVQVKWNNRPIAKSPFHPKVRDPRKVRPVGGWKSLIDSTGQMALVVNEMKRIEFDCSEAGPGDLDAEVRGPYGTNLHCNVEFRGNERYLVSFTPQAEGDHQLILEFDKMPLPQSPYIGIARFGRGQINHEKVVLTGRGLHEANVKEEAEFIIDGTEAGPGIPDVRLSGVKSDIHVRVTNITDYRYKCVYAPELPGAYLLNILWSDRQVRGSPFKVNVIAQSDASKVVCTGEGLKIGIMGRDIKSTIDTRRAGPGELTAHCMGPHKVAYCELYDHRDGTFTLNIKPQEPGRHILQIKYGGEHVQGSPFTLRISGAPDASKVRVQGPGVEHGILATYQSRFIVETRGAGAGQLTVRIRGPKGAFRVEMQRESQKDRTILCRYDPTEVGDYIIHVKWSGEHVPGSPFHVQIFDTQEELENYYQENPHRPTNTIQSGTSARIWGDDF